jgi:hypothetical protein
MIGTRKIELQAIEISDRVAAIAQGSQICDMKVFQNLNAPQSALSSGSINGHMFG